MSKIFNRHLIIITGSSGAGRTTALNALEDRGFEIIDNIPISMIDNLLLEQVKNKDVALGIDIRTRDFSSQLLSLKVNRYKTLKEIKVSLIFLECGHNKLLARYNETRRRHPLSGVKSLTQALREEKALLEPLKSIAEVVIDTTDYSPNDLREELLRRVMGNGLKRLTILVQSFSYKHGLPRNLDMVFDCRFLKNPHWQEKLRDLDGNSDLVKDYVVALPAFNEFLHKAIPILEFLIPLYEKEGKTDFSLGLGCTGGKHRSVVVANELTKVLQIMDNTVFVEHRDL